jgi:hypothetical protein
MAKNKADLDRRKELLEATTCPPRDERSPGNKWQETGDWYSYRYRDARILYEAAPFAVVRWHALHFPADWFAGPLHPNFGNGINDMEAVSHHAGSSIPLVAHSKYFRYHQDPLHPDGAVARLREMLDLNAKGWLEPTEHAPQPDPTTYKYP